MDLSILKKEPDLNKKIKLIISPLAPLSMVSDIPGSYYKTDITPNKFKICGLFENILGWHLSHNDRDKINKELKKKNKARKLNESNSSYKPLIFDLFEVNLSFSGKSIQYNDLWKKSFRRSDADVHPKGTPNLDHNILKKKKWIKEKELEQETIKEEIKKLDKEVTGNKEIIEKLNDKLLQSGTSPLLIFFKANIDAYPTYYTSPTLREFVSFESNIQIGLTIDETLLLQIENVLKECSTGYLGNSEGWVEIKIERI